MRHKHEEAKWPSQGHPANVTKLRSDQELRLGPEALVFLTEQQWSEEGASENAWASSVEDSSLPTEELHFSGKFWLNTPLIITTPLQGGACVNEHS